MAISINCATKVITIPKADLTLVSGSLYELNVEWLRLQLKDWEDSEIGMGMPDTHRRNAPVTLAGTTYAQTFEIINGYTVTFEDGVYTARCVGANHNLADVKNVNSVSLIIGNSAGLITVASGSGLDAAQDAKLTEINAQLVGIEGPLAHANIMRIILAALAGRNTGVGTLNEKYKSQSGSIDRIDATFDANGNRLTVTVNGS